MAVRFHRKLAHSECTAHLFNVTGGGAVVHEDIDSGLFETIQSLTAEELLELQSDAEPSGVADQLRAMVARIERLGRDERPL